MLNATIEAPGSTGPIRVGDRVRKLSSKRIGKVVAIDRGGYGYRWSVEITQPGNLTFTTNCPEIYEVVR